MINLEQALVKQANRIKESHKKKYHDCRKMGFTSTEATILSNWSDDKVRKIAIERGYIKNQEEGRVQV